jgi:hypothetical protein
VQDRIGFAQWKSIRYFERSKTHVQQHTFGRRMTASDKTAKSTLLGNLSVSPQRVKPSAKSASWRTMKGMILAFRVASTFSLS